MSRKFIGIIAAVMSVSMLLASCKGIGSNSEPPMDPEILAKLKVDPELVRNKVKATIFLDDGLRAIELELYPDLAPDTVENFVELAEDGFYDGTIFHRVIKDFMIQGGGYNENLKKKTTNTVKGEFAENGFENSLSHVRGVISMARAQDLNSATSQFFIVQEDSDFLDGKYAAFGRVTGGMDIVDEIAKSKTGTVAAKGMDDVPVDPIVIDTIVIGDDAAQKAPKKSSSSKNSAKNSPSPSPAAIHSDDNDDDETESTLSPKKDDSDDAPIAMGNLNDTI